MLETVLSMPIIDVITTGKVTPRREKTIVKSLAWNFFLLWMEFSKVSKSPGRTEHRSVAGRSAAQLNT